MGMLNYLPDDPEKKEAMRAGLLNLGAAMLQGRGNFGQMLGQGLGAGVQGYAGSMQDQQQAQLRKMQGERWKMENEQTRQSIAEPGEISKIVSRVRGSANGNAPTVPAAPYSHAEAQSAFTEAEAGGMVGVDPARLNGLMAKNRQASGVMPASALPRVGGAAQQPQPQAPRVYTANDYRAIADALAAEGKMGAAKPYYEQAEKMKPKLKEQRTLTRDGKRVTANVYDDGRTEELEGFAPEPEKLHFANTGGSTVGLDAYTGKPMQTIANSQSPDSVASGRVTMRGQDIGANSAAASRAQSERHFGVTQNAGKVPSGYRANPDGSLSAIPGGPADKGAGNMTEDQGKATGWLVQAENAFGNMRKATTRTPSAAKPGINDAIANIPSFGVGEAIGNTFRSADRQKFLQGSSSLSEALLRAATGAGVNKDEAAQKIRELTPVFGESDETTAQKMEAIPLYIESLKVRAGPGAKKAESIGAQKAPKAGTVKSGYVFKGGNPADKANWVKQ